MLTLAALARQNGAIVAVIGALTLGFIDRGAARRKGWLRLAGVAAAALAAMGFAGGLAEAWFSAHSDHSPQNARQWMTLQTYDLAGAVRRDPALPLAVLHRSAPAIEDFIRHDAAPAYDPTRIDPMYKTGRWNALLAKPDPVVGVQWRALMAGWPGLYLAQRWEAFRQVFFTPDIEACAAVLVGVDPGHPDWLRAAGLNARETDKDDWDGDYAHRLPGDAGVRPRHLRPDRARPAGPGGSRPRPRRRPRTDSHGRPADRRAWLYAASFALISIACDYRYLYFLDVAAMAAVVQRAALGFRESRAAATLSKT